jgi:hypothetical protein
MGGVSAPEGIPIFDWIKEFARVRGSKVGKSRVHPSRSGNFLDVFQSPKSEWSSKAVEGGLTGDELAVVGELREYWNKMFERAKKSGLIDMSGDEFVETFLPALRTKNGIKEVLDALPKDVYVSPLTSKFIRGLEQDAIIKKFELDPFAMTMRYLRNIMWRSHVERHWLATKGMLNDVRRAAEEAGEALVGPVKLMYRSVKEYLEYSRGGYPEAYGAVDSLVDSIAASLDITLSSLAKDRLVNTLVSLNYGAFMGLRPGLAIRNLTQTLVVTLPMVGAKSFGRGLEATMRGWDEAVAEARAAGAIAEWAPPVATEDMVYTSQVQALVREAVKGESMSEKTVKAIISGEEKITNLSHTALSGSINVGGVDLPIGMYGRADIFNRVLSYMAGKYKALDAINAWRKGDITVERFNEMVGLTRMGSSITREFHRRLAISVEDAARWYGAQMSNATQWIYQLGAGPAAFSHGFGRIFGMFGTWPAWFAENLRRGLTQGTVADRARFAAWTAAVNGIFWLVAADTGMNIARWTGLASFPWAGSPIFDLGTDVFDIITGVTESGEASPDRALALAKMGMRHIEGGPFFTARVVDPKKLYWNTLAMFTPGAYFYKDVRDTMEMLEGGDVVGAFSEFLGVSEADPMGVSWPAYVTPPNFDRVLRDQKLVESKIVTSKPSDQFTR